MAERTRYHNRLEKLLEDALVKVSSVATDILGVSGRAMLEALIAGERDPAALAGLAKGRMKPKHAQLVQALTGRFDAHHAELARMLLDEVDALSAKVEHLTARINELVAQIPAASPPPARGGPGLPVLARLDEVTGVGVAGAQAIVAEVGLDMAQFPTPQHLVSWAKLSPRAVQSGAQAHDGGDRQGQPLPESGPVPKRPSSAGRTDTFLGERYRRLAKRRGRQRALVAVARSILVIVWHLLD